MRYIRMIYSIFRLGRVHGISAGILLTEIQQTSDITYRIYDYNRMDVNGNLRELHTELAKEVTDYSEVDNYGTVCSLFE